ncbi:MAG: histone-like nucleoid-structuring protein Lsr2, partial [Corynebacterium matruchotii]
MPAGAAGGDGLHHRGLVAHGLDGAHYEIDLSSANAARLRDAIRPFASKGRRV